MHLDEIINLPSSDVDDNKINIRVGELTKQGGWETLANVGEVKLLSKLWNNEIDILVIKNRKAIGYANLIRIETRDITGLIVLELGILSEQKGFGYGRTIYNVLLDQGQVLFSGGSQTHDGRRMWEWLMHRSDIHTYLTMADIFHRLPTPLYPIVRGKAPMDPWTVPEARLVASKSPISVTVDEDASARIARAISPEIEERAASQGFDTSKIYYHGSRRSFRSFKEPNEKGINELGVGIYLTDKWLYANTWARQGGYVYECFIRSGDIFDFSQQMTDDIIRRLHHGHSEMMTKKFGPNSAYDFDGFVEHILSRAYNATITGNRLASRFLQWAGYIGAVDPNSQIPGQIVVFDPANVFIAARGSGGNNHLHEKLIDDPTEVVVRKCIRKMQMSPKAINNGWCWGFALRLSKMLGPEAKIVSTTHMSGVFPGHSVVLYKDRYYDAESPAGVVDPKNLAYSKRMYVTTNNRDL